MSTQFLHLLRNVGSSMASNMAANSINRRAGIAGRIKIERGPRPRGLGFLPVETGGEESYDPYYDSYDWNDYFYGYGGDNYANPPEDLSIYGPTGGGDYSFDQNSWSANDWNWLTGGGNEPFWSDVYGDWTITNPTETGGQDYSDLSTTLDWWTGITGIAPDPFYLPDPNSIDWSLIEQTFPYVSLPTTTPGYSPVIDAPPPRNASAQAKREWLKRIAEALKKGQANAAPGGASSAKPQTAQPNAAGQCPTGYAKNAAGQCVLIPKTAQPTAQNLLGGINPLYLLGGAVLLVLLAKK